MNIEQDMTVSASQIQEDIVDYEAERLNEFRNRVERMVHASFKSDNPQASQAEFKLIMAELSAFEENIVNHELLRYFYSTIARASMHANMYVEAMNYAKAGIKVNEAKDDIEGVDSNARVMLDMACSFSAKDCALEVAKQYPGLADEQLLIVRERMQNYDKGNKLFLTLQQINKPPKSLRICLSEELTNKERRIRTMMKTMRVSRATALKYIRQYKASA